jgi:hypothetical protein
MAGAPPTALTPCAPPGGEGVSVPLMAVPAAFSDLLEISSQVEAAVVLEGDRIVASSIDDEKRAGDFAAGVRGVVEAAEKNREGLKQIEVALPQGNLFVVRDGGRILGAATAPSPPSALVFYDLRTCLSGLVAEGALRGDAAQ